MRRTPTGLVADHTKQRAPDSPKRYYLHGDRHESDSASYYCAQCDVFFDAAHFASHGMHTGERYLTSLERWNKRDQLSRFGWRRPDDAVNLLHEEALASRAEYQRLRPQFSKWLYAQRLHGDEVGVMVGNLMNRRGLPKMPQSLNQLRLHYERRGKGSFYGLDALEPAWALFKRQLP